MNARNLIVTLTASFLTLTLSNLTNAATNASKTAKIDINTTASDAKPETAPETKPETKPEAKPQTNAKLQPVEDGSLPEFPSNDWTKIEAFATDTFVQYIDHWTILSLQTASEAPMDVYVLDADGNLMESFDSTGCGAFLQLDRPQWVYIMVVNPYRDANEYLLNVY